MAVLQLMFVIPSIDLMAGEVVRLAQGKATEKKVYSKDPMAMARRWEKVEGKIVGIGEREEDANKLGWIAFVTIVTSWS